MFVNVTESALPHRRDSELIFTGAIIKKKEIVACNPILIYHTAHTGGVLKII